MNISKRKQGILAVICTIAMIVTSITVYNPREVKAAAFGSGNGMKYTVSGESQEGGLIGFTCNDVKILSAVDGYMHFAWSGDKAYQVDTKTIKAQIDGVDVATYNSNPSDTFIAYNQFKDLEAGEHQIKISGTTSVGAKEIYATATLKIEKVGGTAVEKPSAPVGLVAHIDSTKTNYTIAFAAVAGAESYKFYLNGKYIKDITNGGPKGIVTIEELGLEAGKTYKFGVSAVNAAGESDITTINVTAPGKEEGTTKYTVSIDGTEKQYEEGAKISVPADGQGYYNVTKKEAYAPGTELTVNENMTLKSIALNVTMTKGASIRLAAPTGLRFQTTVKSGNGIAADEILNSKTVTTGTLITTLDLYTTHGNTLTKESASIYTVLDIANNGWFGEESNKET